MRQLGPISSTLTEYIEAGLRTGEKMWVLGHARDKQGSYIVRDIFDRQPCEVSRPSLFGATSKVDFDMHLSFGEEQSAYTVPQVNLH